jgi:hypothetical protein
VLNESGSEDDGRAAAAAAGMGGCTGGVAAAFILVNSLAGLAGNPRYSDARIETKRKQAENEINSAIAAKYVLPLEEVPALLGQICELLAAGYIAHELVVFDVTKNQVTGYLSTPKTAGGTTAASNGTAQ